ncbi:MAG: DUF3667 domain-containing protein [Xanthomonadales bacterium]|nr:DUF3667 domain-containing protein [Xanthomonadales bacterium]
MSHEPLLDDAHFAASACHNCGESLATPYCASCGQKRAERFRLRTIASEAWDKLRLFDFDTLRAIARTLVAPGTVAREFVLGARKRHPHPLKLLLIAIGLLLLVLARSRHLDSRDATVGQAMSLMQSYAQWSFSIGIVAILAASLLAYRRRGGYNFTEHLVLAIYTHFLVILASILSLLPKLVWRSPEFLAMHRSWSGWGMGVIEMMIVALAFTQFFRLDWRRDGASLLIATLAIAGIKWLLLQIYAWLLVKAVMASSG